MGLNRYLATRAFAVVKKFAAWNVSDRVKVSLAVALTGGLATAQILSSTRKAAGHDALSSEKPQVLRKEKIRNLEEEKAKLAAATATVTATEEPSELK